MYDIQTKFMSTRVSSNSSQAVDCMRKKRQPTPTEKNMIANKYGEEAFIVFLSFAAAAFAERTRSAVGSQQNETNDRTTGKGAG